MPITELRRPIATYIAAANAQDIDAVTACFSQTALVHDEKQHRQGIDAIRKWAEEVSEKYHPIVEALDVAEIGGQTIVTGRVSGNFPGSPIELRYAFTLNDGRIERLEIA
jgi:hypothetical protein